MHTDSGKCGCSGGSEHLHALSMSSQYSVPPAVLDLDALGTHVESRREALEAVEADPATVLVEFELVGNWFGSPWRRNREFKWMIYVGLWDANGDWADHAEDLVARPRRGEWVAIQPGDVAVEKAERFARSILQPDPGADAK